VAKTGSTSLLKSIYKDDKKDIAETRRLDTSEHWRDDINHYPLYIIKKIVRCENYENYFKFAFVRNPYDRIVSAFSYDSQFHGMGLDFKKFVFSKSIPVKYDINQYDFVIGSDFIGKFENLQSDFDFICDRLGITRDPLNLDNYSKHKHYSEYYDDETKEFVAKKYAKDIEYFGYEF
jgi:hypothetical protein